MTTSPENSTLSTGKYTIELTGGASVVYAFDTEGNKTWVCSASDPMVAMNIIEGLIMVEHKRFYYPDSKPQINVGTPKPPFLNKD